MALVRAATAATEPAARKALPPLMGLSRNASAVEAHTQLSTSREDPDAVIS